MLPNSPESAKHVDADTAAGFNTAYWAGAVLNKGPILLEPVSGAFWSYSNGVWSEHRDVVALRLPKMLGRYSRKGSIAHVETYLQSILHADEKFIRPDRPAETYVSTPLGLYNLDTKQVEPHRPDVHCTYQLQVVPEFDTTTPEFDRFLKSVVHDGDTERVLDILAYLIRPGNPAQKAVLLTGSGRNGKGVLMRIVEALLGEHNLAGVPLRDLSKPFAVLDLWGKPVNMVGDIDGDHLEATGRFKQITGGDLVRMDVKYGKAFNAHVWAVPVFSANIIPTSSDTSHGYLRRWEVVEFPNTFDGKDTGLMARLLAELPAIAGKLLQRAAAVGPTIRESGPGRRAHDVFAQKSDPVRSWLAETDLSGFVKRGEAYDDYKGWIEDGNGKTPLAKRNFFDRMRSILGPDKKVMGHHGWSLPSQTSPKTDQTSPKTDQTSPKVPLEGSESQSADLQEQSAKDALGEEREVSGPINLWGMHDVSPPDGRSPCPGDHREPPAIPGRIRSVPDPLATDREPPDLYGFISTQCPRPQRGLFHERRKEL